MQANLGDKGDEGKEPSPLEPRVGAAVGVERCTLGMQNLVTRVTKAKGHHRWGRVCGSGGGCREVHLGKASTSWGQGRRRQRAIIVGAACESGGGCREMRLGNANRGDKGWAKL
jgi:hypothetical protein